MKPVSNEDVQEQFNFCKDVWGLYKMFYLIEDTDQYWNSLVNEATALQKKYPSETCKKIILAVLDEFDNRHKGGDRAEAQCL